MPKINEKLDAKTIVRSVRDAGFLLEWDAESDKPVVHPLKKLTADQREVLKNNQELIRAELLREREERSWLNPFDEPGWMELMDWWMTWIPPAGAYILERVKVGDWERGILVVGERRRVVVENPVESYEASVELVRSGKCVGRVELGVYFWVRAHWEQFHNKYVRN